MGFYSGIYAQGSRGRGGPPGAHRTQREQVGYELGQNRADMGNRRERTDVLQGQYDDALADPVGTGDLFRGAFEDYAQGFAAPQQRDFRDSIQTTAANVAGRFGGNASSEEQRQVNQAGDIFSRNLTDAISRLAPQAMGMGLNYTGMLGDAANNAQSSEDRLRALIAELALGRQDKKKGGSIFGSLAGGIAGGLIGGPAGAGIGSQAGGSIFG